MRWEFWIASASRTPRGTCLSDFARVLDGFESGSPRTFASHDLAMELLLPTMDNDNECRAALR
jgi:hypothetical protein